MPLSLATHWGPFHADDVLACSLIREFVDGDAPVTRTRDPKLLDEADVVFDVGGIFDPARRRFDHHQASYGGPKSSAGMVLDWIEADAHVDAELAGRLRAELVEWVDAVDNGRETPVAGACDFTRMVELCNAGNDTYAEFDAAFERAVGIARTILRGVSAAYRVEAEARSVVLETMARTARDGTNVMLFDRYIAWKPAYFDNGGATHCTEFVAFPGIDGSWRAVAIPPVLGSFDQKRSFPEEWAGLRDEELAELTGVPGAKFCHKNRFIAVWDTREGLLEAMERYGLLTGTPAALD